MTRPTVGLVMNVRDSEAALPDTLGSIRGLIDYWTIVDTGSSDLTPELARHLLKDIPGELHEEEWRDYGHNRTLALELAANTADWLLWLDDDMHVDYHPELATWLASDPDPSVDAWLVEIKDHGITFRCPLLTRGYQDWRYVGVVHEYLDMDGRRSRPLLGLTLTHLGEGRGERLEQDLELLRPEAEAGEPRALFYMAETLRFLGRTEEAVAAYQHRAAIEAGFEEERWYAAYQAARLARDSFALVAAYLQRPWRTEPLRAAIELAREQGARDDILFLEG